MFRRIVLALCMLVVAASVPARDVADLYRARVAVADRSAAELARGARVALSEVLVKLTGDPRAPSGPASALAPRASALLQQYTYEVEPEDNTLWLVAAFDPAALDAELAALSVPVWGKERPDTVVWLIVDDASGRHLVSGDDPGRFGEVIVAGARRRGLPVLLPLIDIEESQHLSYAGDWETLSTTAVALSSRYGTPAALVGYVREALPGLWEARWRVQVGDEHYEWRGEGDLVELLLEEGTDTLADALTRRFADPARLAQAEDIVLSIHGLGGAGDYARVTNYLEHLDTVSRMLVSALEGDRVEVRVTAAGGRAALAQSIAFGSVLTPLPGRPDAYRLRR